MLIKKSLIAFTGVLLLVTVCAAEDWGKPPVSFERGDINRDGRLDKNEYDRIVIEEFRGSDVNQDGYLMFNEADERERIFLFNKEERRAQQRINEADYLRRHYIPFNHYDTNGDGLLSLSEYRGWGL